MSWPRYLSVSCHCGVHALSAEPKPKLCPDPQVCAAACVCSRSTADGECSLTTIAWISRPPPLCLLVYMSDVVCCQLVFTGTTALVQMPSSQPTVFPALTCRLLRACLMSPSAVKMMASKPSLLQVRPSLPITCRQHHQQPTGSPMIQVL